MLVVNRLPFSFYLQVVICAALWGSAFPVIKYSYANLPIDGFGDQLLFAGSRFMIAGLMIVPFCRGGVLDTLRRSPKGKLITLLLGQTFFQYVFFYMALSVSSGTLGALLVGAGSLWWVLLAPLMLKTSLPSGRQWLILACCTLGIVIAVYSPGAGSGQVALGAVLFLLTSLSSAIGALSMKQIGAEFGSRCLTSLSLFIGGCLLLVSGQFGEVSFWNEYNWQTFGVTLYLAFLSATAFTLWNRLIEVYSVNLLSAFRFLIPLFGVVESALFIQGESIGIGIVVGGAIVTLSLMAMNKMGKAH